MLKDRGVVAPYEHAHPGLHPDLGPNPPMSPRKGRAHCFPRPGMQQAVGERSRPRGPCQASGCCQSVADLGGCPSLCSLGLGARPCGHSPPSPSGRLALDLLWEQGASWRDSGVLCLHSPPPCCAWQSPAPHAHVEPTEVARPPLRQAGQGWAQAHGHPLPGQEKPPSSRGAPTTTQIAGGEGLQWQLPWATLTRHQTGPQKVHKTIVLPEAPPLPGAGDFSLCGVAGNLGRGGVGLDPWGGGGGASPTWAQSVTLAGKVTSAE